MDADAAQPPLPEPKPPLPTAKVGCPGLEAIEQVLLGRADGLVIAHVAACPACREKLEEVRGANEFLDKFASTEEDQFRRAASHDRLLAIEIPGYDVEAMLGFGGQGAVYRARQKGTGRSVAIKVPFEDSKGRSSKRYRFQREIELTARLDHPGIVGVLGACELADGRIGCVMEYVEGMPIDIWAAEEREHGRAGIRRIIEVMAQVADAIAYAHQHAVMHRDIKPSNVVVTSDGTPHVLDFGLAKSLDSGDTSFATLSGAFVGTLAYSSPEQLSGTPDLTDLRTDVYSLGLLTYQALVGRLPFSTDAPAIDMIRTIRDSVWARPSSVNSDINAELDAIILKAIAKEKERRYANGAQLRDDLRAWLGGSAVRARLDSRTYRVRKALQRHRWEAAGAIATAAALGVFLVLGWIARSQNTRAVLAERLRETRTLEAHWVRLAEARMVARDSFEPGERVAWDALLEPEQILIDEGVEGITPEGPVRTSPAYWALWEMYLRTPLVASLPNPTGQRIVFADPDHVLTADGNELQWWNWRTGDLTASLDLPPQRTATALMRSPTSPLVVATDGAGPAVIVDTERMLVRTIGGDAPVDSVCVHGTRLCTRIAGAPKAKLQLWETAAEPPRLIDEYEVEKSFAATFDVSGEYLAYVSGLSRQLVLVEARTGVASSVQSAVPLTHVGCRGKHNELIVWGPDAWGVLHLLDVPRLEISAPGSGPFLAATAVRSLRPATSGGRYLLFTDRAGVRVGDLSEDITQSTAIPGLFAANGVLPAGPGPAAIALSDSNRCAMLEIERRQPMRLPHPIGDVSPPLATVFDLAFSDDSRWLYTGAMDGSIRAFSTSGDGTEIVKPHGLENGVTRIVSFEGGVVGGSHERGEKNAKVVLRFDDGKTDVLVADQPWICGIEVEAGELVWALTGSGRLFRIDGDGGSRHEVDLAASLPTTSRDLLRLPALGVLLVGTMGNEFAVVREDTLEPLRPILQIPGVRQIVAVPDTANQFATAHDDGMIRIWRLSVRGSAQVELLREMGAHAGNAFSIAFHPDGRLMASGGGAPESKDLRIWDSQTGHELAGLDLFENGIFDLEFSPDGRWLAACGEARLGHAEEGGELYLIDLAAPDACIAGNLEYHARRFARKHGHEPEQAAALRAWAARVGALNAR